MTTVVDKASRQAAANAFISWAKTGCRLLIHA